MLRHIIEQDFYFQDTITVAEQLIGKRIVVEQNGHRLTGIIYETEAYLGLEDPACHSSHGLVTPRTKTFYLPGGHSYVYLIYGMYYCYNIITRTAQEPEAVLIRAVFPELGKEFMQKNSPHIKKVVKFANGPGKFCRAFAIDKSFNELPVFTKNSIYIEYTPINIPSSEIECGPRIGIDYAGDASQWPLRFYYPSEKLKNLDLNLQIKY
ncbi:MAG: DNA-3-methyladenine glycosylase [Bdellovibrionales bacterium]|nr:DNA-3-methyladenine glycosylase [Bdellovibrionales bacterium]